MANGKVKLSDYRWERAVRAPGGCGKVVRLSALRTGRLYFKRLRRLQGRGAAGRINSMIIPNDPTGNRIRDLPACSAVPLPSAPPRRTAWPRVQTINKICTHEKYFTARCPLVLTNNATKVQNELTRTGTLPSFPLRFYFISNRCLLKLVIIWVWILWKQPT
jgi:hypothetical protein